MGEPKPCHTGGVHLTAQTSRKPLALHDYSLAAFHALVVDTLTQVTLPACLFVISRVAVPMSSGSAFTQSTAIVTFRHPERGLAERSNPL